MKYLPIFTAYGYTNLACGGILLISATGTALKIRKGSRSAFAYTLVAFTFATGVVNSAEFMILGFPTTIETAYGELHASS